MFLKDIKVEINADVETAKNPSKDIQLKTVIQVLEEISKYIKDGFIEFKGSYEFTPQNISYVFKEKTVNFAVSEGSDKEYGIPQTSSSETNIYIDLSNEDWYAFNDNYGTSEEKYLVKFIKQAYNSLKDKYEDIYLLRNENHFKLYDFEEGREFQPDFVLFLKENNSDKPIIMQSFIEPKGEQLIEKDNWKQDFLLKIEKKYKLSVLFSNREYKLIGLPFYNEVKLKGSFDNSIKEQFLE